VRYAAQHGAGRVAKVIASGAVPPGIVMSDSNPDEQYRVTHHYTMIGTRQKPVRGREIIFTNLPVDPTAGTEHDR
jgi:hypothetical protein